MFCSVSITIIDTRLYQAHGVFVGILMLVRTLQNLFNILT